MQFSYSHLISLLRALFHETNVSFDTDKEGYKIWITFNTKHYPELIKDKMFHYCGNHRSIHTLNPLDTRVVNDHEFWSELREMLNKYEPELCEMFDEEFTGEY